MWIGQADKKIHGPPESAWGKSVSTAQSFYRAPLISRLLYRRLEVKHGRRGNEEVQSSEDGLDIGWRIKVNTVRSDFTGEGSASKRCGTMCLMFVSQ